MKIYPAVLMTAIIIFLIQANSYAENIPLNPDSLSFTINEGNDEVVVSSNKSGAKLEYVKLKLVRMRYFDFLTTKDLTTSEFRKAPYYYQWLYIYNSYYVDKRRKIKTINWEKKDIKGLVNILNYTDFMHLKNIQLYNTFSTQRQYRIMFIKEKASNEKFLSIDGWGYGNYLFRDKRILRMLFLNEFIESKLFLRKDGKLNLWGNKRPRLWEVGNE